MQVIHNYKIKELTHNGPFKVPVIIGFISIEDYWNSDIFLNDSKENEFLN